MKDNFSLNSDSYAKYRPTYPPELFDYLLSLTLSKHSAWDCGTGNGQVAYELAKHFDKVHATDISQAQIDNAQKADNITYSVQPAEETDFDSNQFDLIVVAQAIHWFDFEKFYSEVRRTAKANALLCVTGYGMVQVSAEVDAVIDHFYKNVIDSYWDAERKYVDENYQTITFPFDEVKAPEFANILQWTSEHLIGYLNTWSAVKHFIKQNGYNPVDDLKPEIERQWGDDEIKQIKFPVLLRIGRI